MDLSTVSEQVVVQGAAIIMAIISLIGTVVTAWLNIQSQKKQRASEAETRAKEEAAQQKKEADKAKKELEEERRARELREIQRSIKSLQEEQEAMSKRSSQRAIRIDRRYNKTNQRIGDNEEGITKITQILAKNARSYSGIMRFNDQTTRKLQQIIQMERHNLALTRGVADILEDLAVAVKSCAEVAQGDFTVELQVLADIIRRASHAKSSFLNSMMDATFETVMSDGERKALHSGGQDSLDISGDLANIMAFRGGNNWAEDTESSVLDEDDDDADIKSLQKHISARHPLEDDEEDDPDDTGDSK